MAERRVRAMLMAMLVMSSPAFGAVCDSSGVDDWKRGWETVHCTDDITWEDAVSLTARIVLDAHGGGGALTWNWIVQELTPLGLDVTATMARSIFKGELSEVLGTPVKAKVLTRTNCKHCYMPGFCVPQPNRHLLCVAIGKKTAGPSGPSGTGRFPGGVVYEGKDIKPEYVLDQGHPGVLSEDACWSRVINEGWNVMVYSRLYRGCYQKLVAEPFPGEVALDDFVENGVPGLTVVKT